MHITKYKKLIRNRRVLFRGLTALRRLIDPIQQPQRRIKEDLGKHSEQVSVGRSVARRDAFEDDVQVSSAIRREIDIGAIGPGQGRAECRLAEHRGWAVAIDTGAPGRRPHSTCSLRWRAVAVGDRLGSRGRWGLAVIFASGHGGWPAFTDYAERGPTPARRATPTAAAAAELLKLSPAQHPCRRRQPGSRSPAPDPGPDPRPIRSRTTAPVLPNCLLQFHTYTRTPDGEGFLQLLQVTALPSADS
ncbi:hypothetical protein TcasGA2_TC005172 [Tribolium castaneum]|uniref:Uncharacterized protein n=1 Tax=Tribolium castaneum TaxID=7070 RepID=D6W7E4_TRICA|nr:hypothetical protein TcasGA2_TC005172 [Tribolium castaneum]